MTDDFDGYRKWLNITSTRRPPSHYELLGINLDEEDHEVIEAAVEQRRNYVESKRGKGHDDLVAEILMRIDEAGITLLNNEMRRDYDRQMELFEKRRKNRRVDPNATSSRFESRPGRTVGEEPVIVKTFAGIMAVICVGFGIMAWFSFQLPWSKKEGQAEATPVANRPDESPTPLTASDATPVSNGTPTKPLIAKEIVEPSNVLERLQAGDRLWQLADSEKQSNSKLEMQKQAINWYRKSLPDLTNEQKKSVEQRLTSLVASLPSVSIAANQSWQSGKKVKRGDLLIAVASDTWNIWPTGTSEWLCDANGTKYNAGDSFPIVGSKQGALIGQIRSKVFGVGSFAIIEAEEDGEFKLMCNDAEKYRPDNQGSVKVQIAIVGDDLLVKEAKPSSVSVAEESNRTYLVTLPRIDLREYNGWWSDKGELLLGGVGGQPINRKPLVFEGQHSVHGIYMHARPSGESFITFRLGGRFESFETKAHIPEMLANQGNPRTPLVFLVIGDGRTLWKSKPLSKKGDHETCSISVKGINDLSLKIECPGPDNWALASWIEPHLLVGGKETTPSSAPAPRDDDRIVAESVIGAGGSLDLLVDGKKLSVLKGGALPTSGFRLAKIELKDLPKVVDGDVGRQPQLSELRELNLMHTSVSDGVFQHLKKFGKLAELNVAGTAVKGSGFSHLKENESLEILLCGGCPISDINLVHLKSCKRLSVLGLIDTNVTDAGMEHLQDIPTLKELRLNGDPVTDKGIQKLSKLTGLAKLSVGRTKVTPAGVNAFKKAVPTCEVQLQ